jgi:nitrite reductase/ring-hydroxylating ferredoxin subunit
LEYELTATANVKEGQLYTIMWNERPILLFRRNGKIYAYLNACQHVGGPLMLKGDRIVCQWHGSTYEPFTGKKIGGPAPEGYELIPFPIVVKDGKIYYVYPPIKPRGEWHVAQETSV